MRQKTSRSIAILLALCMALALMPGAALAEDAGISVTVDGAGVQWTDAEPFIDENSRTMVPLRAVADVMGLEVNWDAEAREAAFTGSGKTICFPIDSNTARTSDDGTVSMDTAAVIVNERTYAPIRYLAEYFGYAVDWDGNSRTVVIKTQEKTDGTKIAYRFADREEGISLKLGNTAYFDNMSQNDMDYRAQKKGATIEDVKEYTEAQILEFSEAEKKLIDKSISTIESNLAENGYTLPEIGEIVFVKTTMKEEGGAEAYTHKTEIYLGPDFMEMLASENEAQLRYINAVMCHEIFHCLTRNDAQFRKDMYSIISFNATGEDVEFGPAVREVFYSNPDVDHHDARVTMTINGQAKECVMAFATSKPFEKEGDVFMDNIDILFVPVDEPNTYYSLIKGEVDKAEYAEKVGLNTGYTIDPEECMADNFSYAVIYGAAGIEGEAYPTPEIIDSIISYLKK